MDPIQLHKIEPSYIFGRVPIQLHALAAWMTTVILIVSIKGMYLTAGPSIEILRQLIVLFLPSLPIVIVTLRRQKSFCVSLGLVCAIALFFVESIIACELGLTIIRCGDLQSLSYLFDAVGIFFGIALFGLLKRKVPITFFGGIVSGIIAYVPSALIWGFLRLI